MDRFGEKVCCNPSIKLQKGETYPRVEIEKIMPGYKYVQSEDTFEFTGGGSKFQDGDVLMARITPCLENGKIAIADLNGQFGSGSTELFVFRGIQDVSNTDYIYYLLCMPHMKQLAANSMTGASGRQRADLGFIKRIKWDFPDITTQTAIANVLSQYDKLIKINTERINTLESIAELIYKRWFVHFRFPGHENTKIIQGVPQGWTVKRLRDYGRIETGKTPSMEIMENYGDEILFIKTPDMHGKTFIVESAEKLSQQGSDTQPKKLLPPNSIMVTCIGTGGVVAINAVEAHTNQQINSIIPSDEKYLEWLFYTCRSLKTTIEMFGATGTTMTNLSKGKFEKLKVLDPGEKLAYEFHEKVGPIMREIKELMYQNEVIIKQKELLLPRLMNRVIEV